LYRIQPPLCLRQRPPSDRPHQSFRLQNQYADHETGLHYNFFRYYEPDAALPKWIAYGVLGTAPLSKPRIPLKDIQPDPIDWW